MNLNAGTFLLMFAEVINVLKADAYIKADGTFDDLKFNDIGSDLKLVGDIEAILKKYGVIVPPKVDQVLQILPLLASLFK
jgi:hypothetical protein